MSLSHLHIVWNGQFAIAHQVDTWIGRTNQHFYIYGTHEISTRKYYWRSALTSQILITRSWPIVSSLRRGASKSIPTTLCFASWNDANDVWLWTSDYYYYMLSNVTTNIFYYLSHLLICFKLGVAWITDSYFKLKTHRRYWYTLRRTTSTKRTTTVATMMLPQSKLSLVHHCFDVPKERPSARLKWDNKLMIWCNKQDNFIQYTWHVSDSTHTGVSLRLADMSHTTITPSSPPERSNRSALE